MCDMTMMQNSIYENRHSMMMFEFICTISMFAWIVGKITERSAHKYNLERTIPNVISFLHSRQILSSLTALLYIICVPTRNFNNKFIL